MKLDLKLVDQYAYMLASAYPRRLVGMSRGIFVSVVKNFVSIRA
jgi:hypothetical protein